MAKRSARIVVCMVSWSGGWVDTWLVSGTRVGAMVWLGLTGDVDVGVDEDRIQYSNWRGIGVVLVGRFS
jgi:hypothetical protein